MSKSRILIILGKFFKLFQNPPCEVSPGDPVGLPNAIVISDRIPKHSPCRMGVNIISPV